MAEGHRVGDSGTDPGYDRWFRRRRLQTRDPLVPAVDGVTMGPCWFTRNG
ncbi:MAG: hypothetical protein ACXV5Q_01045 [Frankiaceae bacterium]